MKQEKNTVQFSEIRSKGCNDIEMLERFLHTEVINRFKECYTGGGIQGFTIQFDKNTLASA